MAPFVPGLKGLSKVKKTLADGKTIYYCYAWRGGPLLKHKDGSRSSLEIRCSRSSSTAPTKIVEIRVRELFRG